MKFVAESYFTTRWCWSESAPKPGLRAVEGPGLKMAPQPPDCGGARFPPKLGGQRGAPPPKMASYANSCSKNRLIISPTERCSNSARSLIR